MAGPTDREHSEQHRETGTRLCPLCGEHYPPHQRPRHQVLVEDEAPTHSQIVERSVCPPCWEALYAALSEDKATPIEVDHDADNH